MKDTQIIAEIGQAHDGSLGILYSLVDSIANAGVKIIKFQMHIADAESSVNDQFRTHFSKINESRTEYWKRMELSTQEWSDLKHYCESLGCEFLCTPFSVRAVDTLESLDVARYKIGSGDLNNHLLLRKVAMTGKPVILSTGLATYEEIDDALDIFRKVKSSVSIMQCTSEYPAHPKSWGLNLIGDLQEKFNVEVGYSDHSGKIASGVAAAALGANLLEVHVTFDKRMFGPDSLASLTIDELAFLVECVNDVDTSLSCPQTKDNVARLGKMRDLFGRSLTVSRDIEKGEELHFDHLEAAKPFGYGIDPREYHSVIGKTVRRNLKKYDFLNEDDLK